MKQTKDDVLSWIRELGLLPVVRARDESQAVHLVDALVDGGVTALEITMTIPGALRVLGQLRDARPDLLLGAGTVLDPETARICILEGAQFIVSPSLNLQTVELCKRYSVAAFPGALTPTEVLTAWQAGADVVKIFPASAMGGARYIASLKAPFPHVEMIPTGGISHATAADFLGAGCFALGVGADLADTRHIAEGHPEKITANSRRYLEIIRQFREDQRATSPSEP